MGVFRKHVAVGERFGNLAVTGEPVLEWEEKHRLHRVFYQCVCDCGNKTVVRKDHLGKTKSCGCQRRRWFGPNNPSLNLHHGESNTRLYGIWNGMHTRCYNPNEVSYHYYGGCGITVCAEWHNYPVFRDWAMSHGYHEDLMIDRIDGKGNYCPENCRWATWKEQNRNKRTNRHVTAWGETNLLCEWVEDPRCKVNYNTLQSRLNRGWTAEDAISTPARKRLAESKI